MDHQKTILGLIRWDPCWIKCYFNSYGFAQGLFLYYFFLKEQYKTSFVSENIACYIFAAHVWNKNRENCFMDVHTFAFFLWTLKEVGNSLGIEPDLDINFISVSRKLAGWLKHIMYTSS